MISKDFSNNNNSLTEKINVDRLNSIIVINDLPAGTYAFICNTAGHYEQGMVYKWIAR